MKLLEKAWREYMGGMPMEGGIFLGFRNGFEHGQLAEREKPPQPTINVEREKLRLGKYTSGYEKLTPEQLQGLLWLLGEWSCRADEDGTLRANKGRAEAARKALCRFTRNPLTVDEARALMREAARR
jgi:hypothetical protein